MRSNKTLEKPGRVLFKRLFEKSEVPGEILALKLQVLNFQIFRNDYVGSHMLVALVGWPLATRTSQCFPTCNFKHFLMFRFMLPLHCCLNRLKFEKMIEIASFKSSSKLEKIALVYVIVNSGHTWRPKFKECHANWARISYGLFLWEGGKAELLSKWKLAMKFVCAHLNFSSMCKFDKKKKVSEQV